MERKIAQRPAPPDPVQHWRATLRRIAQVYGDDPAVEMAEVDQKTDDEIRQDWQAMSDAITKAYAPDNPYNWVQSPSGEWSDRQLATVLESTPPETRAKLESMSDEDLRRLAQ